MPIGHLTGRKLEVVKRCVSKWWHSFSFQAFDETGCHLLVTQSCMDKLRMHERLKFYSKVSYAITINLNSFKVSLVNYIISKYLNSKHVNNCLLFYKKKVKLVTQPIPHGHQKQFYLLHQFNVCLRTTF